MLYDFVAINTHTTRLGAILDAMEQNRIHLIRIKQNLLDCGFTGAGATGYDSVTTELNAKLDDYGASLAKLRTAIGTAASRMQLVDENNGKGFYGI
ncbi:WXG100 family type VII secretion target [Nocardia jejuensis]|uniref:WXG100 family type VII secretion target n=1 Tax=Nocardia jejuensis TaxID=328049 RepID=UPI00082F78FE|nr:hypothetical protein [Nocardia jejuensis]